jgi:hypothetical protein
MTPINVLLAIIKSAVVDTPNLTQSDETNLKNYADQADKLLDDRFYAKLDSNPEQKAFHKTFLVSGLRLMDEKQKNAEQKAFHKTFFLSCLRLIDEKPKNGVITKESI